MDGWDSTALARRIDEFVANLLDSLALTTPPFDPRVAARRLGFEVLTDASHEGRGRHVRIAGRTVLLVKPEERSERSAWALAHELGEALMPDLAERLGGNGSIAEGRSRETVANLFATRFLLPTRPFREALEDFDGELPAIKRRFANASHELVAMRLLDFSPCGIVSIFDQGRLTRRVAAEGRPSGRLAEAERRCREEIRTNRVAHRCDGDGWVVRGWAVDEPGWEREILVAHAPEEGVGG
jgi:predicted transcriptional regulator